MQVYHGPLFLKVINIDEEDSDVEVVCEERIDDRSKVQDESVKLTQDSGVISRTDTSDSVTIVSEEFTGMSKDQRKMSGLSVKKPENQNTVKDKTSHSTSVANTNSALKFLSSMASMAVNSEQSNVQKDTTRSLQNSTLVSDNRNLTADTGNSNKEGPIAMSTPSRKQVTGISSVSNDTNTGKIGSGLSKVSSHPTADVSSTDSSEGRSSEITPSVPKARKSTSNKLSKQASNSTPSPPAAQGQRVLNYSVENGYFICETCDNYKLKVTYEDSFKYHLYMDLHCGPELKKPCYKCGQLGFGETGSYGSCPLVNEIMDRLLKEKELQEEILKKQKSQPQQQLLCGLVNGKLIPLGSVATGGDINSPNTIIIPTSNPVVMPGLKQSAPNTQQPLTTSTTSNTIVIPTSQRTVVLPNIQQPGIMVSGSLPVTGSSSPIVLSGAKTIGSSLFSGPQTTGASSLFSNTPTTTLAPSLLSNTPATTVSSLFSNTPSKSSLFSNTPTNIGGSNTQISTQGQISGTGNQPSGSEKRNSIPPPNPGLKTPPKLTTGAGIIRSQSKNTIDSLSANSGMDNGQGQVGATAVTGVKRSTSIPADTNNVTSSPTISDRESKSADAGTKDKSPKKKIANFNNRNVEMSRISDSRGQSLSSDKQTEVSEDRSKQASKLSRQGSQNSVEASSPFGSGASVANEKHVEEQQTTASSDVVEVRDSCEEEISDVKSKDKTLLRCDIIDGNYVCLSCNYKTNNGKIFKNHLWKHIHRKSTMHCEHIDAGAAPQYKMTQKCPIIIGLIQLLLMKYKGNHVKPQEKVLHEKNFDHDAGPVSNRKSQSQDDPNEVQVMTVSDSKAIEIPSEGEETSMDTETKETTDEEYGKTPAAGTSAQTMDIDDSTEGEQSAKSKSNAMSKLPIPGDDDSEAEVVDMTEGIAKKNNEEGNDSGTEEMVFEVDTEPVSDNDESEMEIEFNQMVSVCSCLSL